MLQKGKFLEKKIKEQNPPKGPRCRKCSKYGHIAKDCYSSKKENTFCSVLSTIETANGEDWFFDTGASVHMTRNAELLQNVKPSNGTVVAANGGNMKFTGTRSYTAKPSSCSNDEIPVCDVQVLPELSVNPSTRSSGKDTSSFLTTMDAK